MSVTEDSVLGEAEVLRVKKAVNLLPGVCGFFTSTTVNDLVEDVESVLRGGGLDPSFGPISSSIITLSTEKPFDRLFLCIATVVVVGLSAAILERELLVLVLFKLRSSVFLRDRIGDVVGSSALLLSAKSHAGFTLSSQRATTYAWLSGGSCRSRLLGCTWSGGALGTSEDSRNDCPSDDLTRFAALDGRGFRRTGETGEKGFRAAARDGRRCRGRLSFRGGGGGTGLRLPGGCASSSMAMGGCGFEGV